MSNRTWTGVLAGLSAASSVVVVILAMRVQDLTEEVRHLRFARNLPQVGDVVPGLRVPVLDGDSVELGRPGPGRRQVWLVFNTTCPICRASLPQWKAASGRLEDDSTVAVIGVSLDSAAPTRSYVQEEGVPYSVAVLDDPMLAAMYRIPGVPITMVVDDQGRLLLVRPGRFTPAAVDSLERALAKVLPADGGVRR